MKNTQKTLTLLILASALTFGCSEDKPKVNDESKVAAPNSASETKPNTQIKAPAEVILSDLAQQGKAKSAECLSCHGVKGISYGPLWPNLAGLSSAYIEKQLKNFRNETRINPMMNLYAKSLSDEDIKQLAAYYGSLKR